MEEKFKINGKPIKIILNERAISKIAKELDKMPQGELIVTAELLRKFNISLNGGYNYNKIKESLKDYFCKYGNKIVWGSRKTIGLFKKTIM